jgi:uncharacterized protein (UPF0179 family)
MNNAFTSLSGYEDYLLNKELAKEQEISVLKTEIRKCSKCRDNATCLNCNIHLNRLNTLQNALQEVTL